jgi:hypothetical protein
MNYDFARAMEIILDNRRVRRADWHRPHYVGLRDFGGITMVAMIMKNGVMGPYTPSHCDMLANDWQEVQ